ncbi:MAG: hypothetical protein JKX95_05230 [Bacteroidia bacterium]|nr:hypothetical protein [Bacteroidia bacterium]
MKIYKYTILVSSVFLLISCGENSTTNNQIKDSGIEDTQEKDGKEITQVKLDYVINNIPSPIIIVNDILDSGIPYKREVMFPTDNAQSLGTSSKTALCLGIYGADLCYTSLYEQAQDAINYMVTVKKLADYLGISAAVGEPTMGTFEKHISNQDSLVHIVFSMYASMDKYLRSNDRVANAVFILAGGWIETFYLTIEMVKTNSDGNRTKILRQRINENKHHLKNLLDLLSDFQDQHEFNELISQLQEIMDVYNDLDDPNKISDEEFEMFSNKITSLRNNLPV